MREILNSDRLPKPRFRYSPCIKAGPFYHMAGMIAIDLTTGKLTTGGPQAETTMILKNLVGAMQDWGLTLENLVAATIFTTRFEDFSLINKAWEVVFHDGVTPPARTTVGVAQLPLGASVEIEFRAYKG